MDPRVILGGRDATVCAGITSKCKTTLIIGGPVTAHSYHRDIDIHPLIPPAQHQISFYG